MIITDEIRKRLKRHLEEGETLGSLASRIGISRSTLTRTLNYNVFPSSKTVEKMDKFLKGKGKERSDASYVIVDFENSETHQFYSLKDLEDELNKWITEDEYTLEAIESESIVIFEVKRQLYPERRKIHFE